jgi:hypothetical protein
MNTFNFSVMSNTGNDPRRTEQLRLASQIDLDEITWNPLDGPPGAYGFRKGTFSVRYHGETVRFFSSVPHQSELAGQAARIIRDAALHIAGMASGYTTA